MTKYHRHFGIAALGLVLATGIFVSGANALDATISADAEMHIGPGADFPIVGRVPADAEVLVNGCTDGNGWCVVLHGGNHGWVARANVNVTGITRRENNFDDAIIVINVPEGRDRANIRDSAFDDRDFRRDPRFRQDRRIRGRHRAIRSERANIRESAFGILPFIVEPDPRGAQFGYRVIAVDPANTRDTSSGVLPFIIEQEGGFSRNGRRVYRSGVGVAEPVQTEVPDFTTVIQVD